MLPSQVGGGSSDLVVSRKPININTSGDNTIIVCPSPTSTISVYGIEYFCNVANSITLKDSTPTTLLPVESFAANSGVIRDMRSVPWYVCTKGKDFVINLSASQQVSGIVYYTVMDS